MSGLNLTTEQKQTTKLSPAQIQVMRLLEIPSIELMQRINEELQANPALEEGADPTAAIDSYNDNEEEEYINPLKNNDFDYDDYVSDDEKPDYNPYQSSSDDSHTDIPVVNSTTLMEHLKAQVYLTKMDKPQRHIAKWVLGCIDDDGYLRSTIEQLVDLISFQENLTVSDEEMADIVNQIKQFDPAGVAAMDVQECLLNQLKQKKSTPAIELAILILSSHFEEYTKHHFDKLLQRLNIEEQELKDAIVEIQRLNSKPANAFNGNNYESHKTTIIPDFVVENREGGELFVSLNTGDIPELHVSPEYNDMLKEYSGDKCNDSKSREAAHFLKEKIDSANWFIDAIRQRNETLMRTMEAIVKRQRDFFLEGDETFLRPMILQDIANDTGYDISTISRVSNSKYVQTDFGIFPLKHFFSESLSTESGEEVSTREVKKILKEEVDNEDKSNPLTDDMLVKVLSEHGYKIARRTIAKYREQMDIPVARLRKVF